MRNEAKMEWRICKLLATRILDEKRNGQMMANVMRRGVRCTRVKQAKDARSESG